MFVLKERTHSISKAAAELGVSPGWLRFGERLGSLPKARRTEGGHRYYTLEDINKLRRLGVGQRKKSLAERSDG